MSYFKYLPVAVFAMLAANAGAQASFANTDVDAEFKSAKDMYIHGLYSLAYPVFKTLYYGEPKAESSLDEAERIETKFYTLSCGLMFDDAVCVEPAEEFIRDEHSTPLVQKLSYRLGEYYFRKENFNEAFKYYDIAGTENLSNAEIMQLKYHEAYGYFTMQQYNKAEPLFNAIRQIPQNENYVDVNYYYGFIEFYKDNYNEALNALKIAAPDEHYKRIVPYYIAEIYYFKGDVEQSLSYAQNALQRGNQYYETELKQLIGHIYFEKGQYANAQPYLENYITKSPKINREDLYELAYCYYAQSQWNKAIDGFKELSGGQDSLAQNSMYLLAEAYLKTDRKANARNAFLFCSLNSSNGQQKEISAFNYAKLSYELGYQDIALNELKKFTGNYPNSNYNKEAKELLINVLANTDNYKEALQLINTVGTQSPAVQSVYPRILYGRAVELINEQNLPQANKLINEIFTLPGNREELQPAYFWKGEIAYRQQRYDDAVRSLNAYLQKPQTYGDVNSKNAYYDLGYAYLRKGLYDKALSSFQQVVYSSNSSLSDIEKDAYLREADCYFMQKNYAQASKIYDAVINGNWSTADYAYYQKAVIAGAYGRLNEKIALLQSFRNKYQSSSLNEEANMQMANAYMASENFSQAIAPLNAVVSSDANALKPAAYLDLGVSYFNMNNNEASLANFQKLISAYPNSEQSNEATDYVKNIFINQNQPDKYVAFMQQNGKDVSYSEQDSLTYYAAFRAYGNSDVTGAQQGFRNYIDKFPQGQNSIDADYYLAEIYNQQKDYINAVKYYQAVADKAPNKYAENAVLQAARINYFQLKDYTAAAKYYAQLKNIAATADNKLESMRGLLRCQYTLKQWTDAVSNAQDLLRQNGIADDDKQIANLIIAKNYQAQSDNDNAIAFYKKVYATGKSEYAAEARYRVAEILYSQAQYKDAEKAAFDVINNAGSYDYWITGSYILLGQIYFRENDLFNAEATLKSVVANASDADLKQQAQQILEQVQAAKKQDSKLSN